MAGFLVAWTRDGSPPNPKSWKSSIATIERHHESIAIHCSGKVSLAAWRREHGEFPLSGTVISTSEKKTVWIGQSVEDSGDSTAHSIEVVNSNDFNGAATAAINGPFAAVVVNSLNSEVRVVIDRYRNYPVYLHCGANVTVASTDIHCLVFWMERVALDKSSVDMLLRCGELIDRMTLLEGVDLLPPGTVLSDIGNGPIERRYWSMEHDGSRAESLDVTAEKLAQSLKLSVRRLESVSPRLGVTLSGGLDSRIILDLCRDPGRIPSFTWGLAGCRDIECARKFASLVKSPHTVKHWHPVDFPERWGLGVDLTAGSFGIESMHMLPFIPLLSSKCDVVLNGLAGDAILGGNFLKYAWLNEESMNRLGQSVWRWRVTEREDAIVDELSLRESGGISARDRWVSSIVAKEGCRPIERVNDWLYDNRVFRNTNSGTMLLRSGVESHAPFFDRDFIDTVTKVRQEHKFKHRIYLEVMKKIAPRSASVTWQRTNIPPGWGYAANVGAMALQSAASKLAAPLGYQPFKSLAVADPSGWLRGPWRQPIRQILDNRRLFDRGIVNHQSVKNILNAHMNGVNFTRQIGVLVAIELFARQVVDRDPS